MKFKEVFGSHLKEDLRRTEPAVAQRKIYADSMYDIFLSIYRPIKGQKPFETHLVTFQVDYKEEGLRVVCKLWPEDLSYHGEPYTEYFEQAISRLDSQYKTPMHLVLDAKSYCGLPLTQGDQKALSKAGIPIPSEG